MKKIIFSIVALMLSFTSCKEEKTEIVENTAFSQFLEDYYQGGLQLNPIGATFAGDNRYNDQFPDFLSDEFQQKAISFYQKYATGLEDFKDESLTDDQKMSKAILAWDTKMTLAQLSFKKDLLLPINQMWTINLTIGQLASGSSAQPFKTVEDYNKWLQRLLGFNKWLLSAKSRMEQGIKEGFVLPASLTKKIIPQFEGLATTKLEDHLFYSPIKKFPEGFSSSDKESLTNDYIKLLSQKLIPSFKEVYTFLKTDYLKASRKTSGISDTPNGEAYYNHSIKYYTTTDMTADEIHNLGLKEVARILSEMEKVKEQVGFKGTIKEFFNHVRDNKELMPYKTPKEILDNFNTIHERMKPQLEKLFGNKPKTAFVVKQTEKFREASASAEYNSGSLDGTRPGIFYTPIPDASIYNVFQDEALFLH